MGMGCFQGAPWLMGAGRGSWFCRKVCLCFSWSRMARGRRPPLDVLLQAQKPELPGALEVPGQA